MSLTRLEIDKMDLIIGKGLVEKGEILILGEKDKERVIKEIDKKIEEINQKIKIAKLDFN